MKNNRISFSRKALLDYHLLCSRILKAEAAIGEVPSRALSIEEKTSILTFMLQPDEGGYYMPNLQGCLPFPINSFYELLNAANPRTAEEFEMIVGLSLARFKSRRRLLASIKENGLEMTISGIGSLHRLLSIYEIADQDILAIIYDVLHGRLPLYEWEELILESHEVPGCITEQFLNIVSMPPENDIKPIISAIYEACYLKHVKGYPMEDSDPANVRDGFVGPFFFIGGSILSKKQHVGEFDIRRRYFDVETSHMNLFEESGIEGDYGHYPRGRVLFDNFRKRFVIYMDVALHRLEIKEQVKEHFGLMDQKIVFQKDDHYVHDDL